MLQGSYWNLEIIQVKMFCVSESALNAKRIVILIKDSHFIMMFSIFQKLLVSVFRG